MEQYFADVWSGGLALKREELQSLFRLLSDAEREKADDFKLAGMRDRYVATRGLLRSILAGYLRAEPSTLQFEVGEFGKPGLACGSLHFNISHSGDWLLVVVANFADVGIDIEIVKPRISLDGLARRCFSDREFESWRRLDSVERSSAFYRLWTKKEAFVKAVGRGMALGLDQCEVELAAGGGLVAIPPAYGSAGDWAVTELAVGVETCCAAMVAPRREFVLRMLSIEAIAERAE